jgi:molybdopterin/thiamine biosynthesis adenylyltransferase
MSIDEIDSNIQALESTESVNPETSRFSSAEWFKVAQKQSVCVCGVGGIGSWAAFMLSRLNPKKLIMIDPDVVEDHNLGGQFYSSDDIGQYKADAMAKIIQKFSGFKKVECFHSLVTSATKVPPVVFGGFDNMKARKALYEAWKANLPSQPATVDKKKFLLIDGRLSAEQLQVFCFTGADDYYMAEYEKNWLFSDDEAESTVCSYKQTSYCANLIGSLMANLFINWCTNQCDGLLIDRALPFMTEYEASQMFLREQV